MYTQSVVPSSINYIVVESVLITGAIESDVSTTEGLANVCKLLVKLRLALTCVVDIRLASRTTNENDD